MSEAPPKSLREGMQRMIDECPPGLLDELPYLAPLLCETFRIGAMIAMHMIGNGKQTDLFAELMEGRDQ